MSAKRILSLSVCLLLPVTAFGFGYLDALGLGSPMPGIDAVAHGFGGVSSVSVGSMDLFANPAGLSGTDAGIKLTVGPLILKQMVDDGLGRHTLTYAGLGASSFQANFSAGNTALALGIAKIRDYTYKGEYFFLDTNPEPVISGFENLTVSGGVYEAALGAAQEIAGGVKIGASAGYRMGNIDYEYYWHHFSSSYDDSSSTWSREEGEFAWKAGASVATGVNSTFGAVYSSATDNCASSIAAGIVFGDLSEYFPGVGLEAVVYDTGDNTAWTAKVFGGMHPEHNLYFRGGVYLSSSGNSDADPALGIAIGATVNFSWVDLNAAFNYGSESRISGVFGFPDADTIDDMITAFSVGAAIPL